MTVAGKVQNILFAREPPSKIVTTIYSIFYIYYRHSIVKLIIAFEIPIAKVD